MFIFYVNDFNNCQPLGINKNHGLKSRPCEKFLTDFCTSESSKNQFWFTYKKMVLKSAREFLHGSTLV